MAERRAHVRDVITLGEFVELAAQAAGGMEALRRRLGISKESLEAMGRSETPMPAEDATGLFKAFGLSPTSVTDSRA